MLGALFGLGFGIVSQTINSWFLPGLRFYQPPLGPAGNVGLITAGGALLGLLSSWADNSIIGVLVGSTVSMLAFVLDSVLRLRTGSELRTGVILISLFMFLLPLVALAVPVVGLFRWAVNRQTEARHDREPLASRLPLPLALFVIVSALGALALYHSDARTELARMDLLVQEGLQAANVASLPRPLQAAEIGNFREQARGAYTLTWDRDEQNRYRVPRPAYRLDEQALVIARFANGYTLICLFVTPIDEPECQQYP
jgi:uncharacterized membrane protein YidH (DUF202 family)